MTKGTKSRVKLILVVLIIQNLKTNAMKNFKTLRLFAMLSLLFVLTTSSMCSSDSSSTSNSTADVVNIVNTGTWRVTYYYDTDHEETSAYTGYTFTFGPSNVLTATNGSTTNTGTWSVLDSNSNDDSISDLDFTIDFSSPAQFAELSDDWEIMEKTATLIKLRDVSGGNGGTDYLTFTKN